jgi:SRSO17 transposase
MIRGLLMELDDHNCWTIAAAVGRRGPHRLQHLLSRAVSDEQQVLGIAAAWAAGHLDDGDAVLIVDETVGRALYLPGGCGADEEQRELAGVSEEVMSASKPQLAGALLGRAHRLGIRAAFVAGDEVYGGCELRRGIRQREMGYVMAVRANHAVTTGSGRTVTAAAATRMIPARAWQRMRAGSGTKGAGHYDWVMDEVTSDDTPDGHAGRHSALLVRRHRYTRTLSFY